MTEPKVFSDVADTVTEKPVSFDIDVKPKSKIHKLLLRLKLAPTKHHFEIKPQRFRNVYRIAGRAVTFDVSAIVDSEDGIDAMMNIMAKHGKDIEYIVAAALQNDHREPTQELLDIVGNDFEIEDIYTVLVIAVSNYRIQSFLNSTALIVGMKAILNKQAGPMKTGV